MTTLRTLASLSSISAWVGLAIVVDGCAPRSPTNATHAADDAAGASRASTTTPWSVTILPASTSERSVAVGPSLYRVVEGRRRIQSDGGRIEIGADIPGAKLVDYDITDAGTTVFVDDLGSLYRSASFAGPLVALSTAGVHWEEVAATNAYAYVCAEDGTLGRIRLRDGSGVEKLPQRCATDFWRPLLALDGVVFLVDGERRLSRARDGEPFAIVDTGGHAILELTGYGGAQAKTAHGNLRLEDDGSVTPVDPTRTPEAPVSFEFDDERDKALRALEREYDARHGDGWVIPRARRLGDGRFWTCSDRACRTLGADATPRALEGRCETERVGESVLALCEREPTDEGPAELSIHRLAGGDWTLHAQMRMPQDPTMTGAPPKWIGDADGAVLVAGACDSNEGDPEGWCWLDRGTWRVVEARISFGNELDLFPDLVALRDRWLVLAFGDGGYVRVDLRSGDTLELTSPRGRRRVVGTPVFHGDELFAAIAEGETLAVSVHGENTQRSIAVPRGATSVGFADAGRFLAAGGTADALWTTTDAGVTWVPLEIPVEGDPAAVAIEWASCTNAACTASPVAWVDPALLDVVDHHPPKLVARPRSLER